MNGRGPSPDREMESGRRQPRVPDHDLLGAIGWGAYGEVWLARNAMGTLRAVKLVHRSEFEQDEHFDREFKGLQQFEPVSRTHDGLVDILHLGYDTAAGNLYYVMELADPAPEPPLLSQPHRSPAPATKELARKTGSRPRRQPPLGEVADYTPHTLRYELRTRGPLPLDRLIDLGLRLCSALSHLHQHGLVHRDVKPSNVIFVAGEPKLADAGLVARMDDAHSLVGTAGYIAPEGPGTPRGDIYGLGKLLYEAAFGKDRQDFPQLPADFARRPEHDRLLELNEIILRACAHDPEQRYASAEEFRRDLERLRRAGSVRRHHRLQHALGGLKRWAPALGLVILAITGIYTLYREPAREARTTGPEPTVWVLPFRSLASAEAPLDQTEYSLWLCGRLTDAFIDGLGTVPGLRVGPRRSGWARFDEDEIRREVAKTNSTPFFLCGRLVASNATLRLRLQLFERGHDTPGWQHDSEASTNELVALFQRGIEQVLKGLGRDLDADLRARIGEVCANNQRAFQWFLQARAHHLTSTKAGHRKAMDCFDRALALDGRYVQAHEGYVELFREFFDSRPSVELWPVLAERSRRILEIDETSFVAWDRYLDKLILYDHDWDRAVAECERQSKIWPDHVLVWSVRYRFLGRTNESRRYHEQLKQAQPINTIERRRSLEHLMYGELLWRNYPEAFRIARRYLDSMPENPSGQYLLGRCYEATGQWQQAIEAYLKSAESWPSPEFNGRVGRAFALLGDTAKAQEHLARLEEMESVGEADPYFAAWVHAALGDTKQVLAALHRAIDCRSEMIVHTEFGGLRTDPAWEPLRDHPAFEELCQRVGMGKHQWPK